MNESDDEVIESADQTIERAKEAIDDANRLIQAAKQSGKQSRITMDVMKRQLSGEVERDSVKADDQKDDND